MLPKIRVVQECTFVVVKPSWKCSVKKYMVLYSFFPFSFFSPHLSATCLFIEIHLIIYFRAVTWRSRYLEEVHLLHKNIHYLYHPWRPKKNQLQYFTWE